MSRIQDVAIVRTQDAALAESERRSGVTLGEVTQAEADKAYADAKTGKEMSPEYAFISLHRANLIVYLEDREEVGCRCGEDEDCCCG